MTNPIRRSALPITEVDLAQFEAQYALELPADYRAFLLATNGGVPKAGSFAYQLTTGKMRRANLKAFFPLTPYGWIEPEHPTVPVAREQLCAGWPPEYLAVGRSETDVNSGLLCVGVSGEDAGRVFFCPDSDTKKSHFYDVAKSLPELLAAMKPEFKVWKWDAVVEAGDPEAFRAWCDAQRRRVAENHIGIVRKCVEEDQAALLDVLLAEFPEDSEPSSFVEESLDRHRLDLALRFLPTAAAKRGLPGDLMNRAGPYFWHAPVLVAALLDAGANPTHESEDGDTPLHHAVRAGAAEAVTLLLDRGADPTHANDAEETPLGLAEKAESPEIAASLRAAIDRWKKANPAPDASAVTPFDLCGVTFGGGGKPIGTAEIAATEAKLKLSFPPEYRWLLTQANGGVPSAALMPLDVFPELRHAPDEDDEDEDEDAEPADEDANDAYQVKLTLLTLRQRDCPEFVEDAEDDDDDDSPTYAVEDAIGWYHDGSEMPRGMVPIGALQNHGDGAGLLLLGCKGKQLGQLFTLDHRPTALNFTLPELFARLARAATKPKTPADLLADAIQARDLDGVRAVLHHGATKLYASRDGRRPLYLATEAGYDEALTLMAEVGDWDDLLTHALGENRIDFVRTQLLGGGKVKKEALRELLHHSNLYRDLAMLEAVVARGVKLDKPLADKERSILLAAAQSRNVAALEYLLARGGDVHYVGYESGQTLLHAAATGGYHKKVASDPRPMVAFLIGKGVPVHRGDGNTLSALHSAISAGDRVAAEALIDAGASMTVGVPRNAPVMDTPQMRKLMGRAGKAFDTMLKEFDTVEAPDLGDEDALDIDDPAQDKLRETMGQLGGMQDTMKAMMGKLQARMETPLAERIGATAEYMFAHRSEHKDLVTHLVAYEAGRK